jgi:hypothetical protein
MKKFHFAVILFSVLLAGFINADAQHKEDVVYLKNGSVIHGSLIEVLPNESVKIQTADRNIFVFKMEEVNKILTENSDSGRVKMKPFSFEVSADYMVGIGQQSNYYSTSSGYRFSRNDNAGWNYFITGSYRVNPNFAFGLGAGYQTLSGPVNDLPKTEFIPTFFHMKSLFSTRGKVLPGFSLNIGYEFGLTKEHHEENYYYYYYSTDTRYKGGVFLNPSFNLTVRAYQKVSFCLNVGYEYRSHTINYSYTSSYNPGSEASYVATSSYLHFGAGVEF